MQTFPKSCIESGFTPKLTRALPCNLQLMGQNRKNEQEDQPGHRALRLKSGLIATLLVAIGLALTLLHEKVFHDDVGIIGTVVHHLSTAFLIAGLWHAIEVFFARREFFEAMGEVFNRSVAILATGQRTTNAHIHDLSDQIKASRHDLKLGFVRSYIESHPELYEEIILRPQSLTMVLNNGSVWVNTHRDELKERFADPSKSTRLIVLHPESTAAGFMEAKEHMAKGGYTQRIGDAITTLETLLSPETKLEIYGVTLPITQAIFISENKALVVPRFAVEPSVPPVFEFDKNDQKKSYYRRLSDDVEHLVRHPETRKLQFTTASQLPLR